MTHLDGLNQRQKQAVEHAAGPLMVLAGAGSGKTRVITHRIINLIKHGVSPERILAVTFTNKAAREMRERVVALIDADPELNRPVSARLPAPRARQADSSGLALPFVSTFHALGVSLLREHARELGLKRHFTILDRADSTRAIKRSLKTLGLDPKQFEPRTMLGVISRAKSDGYAVSDYTADVGDTWRHTVGRIWQEYEHELAREGALDFDDLLLRTYHLLRDNHAARERVRERWTHIHIDEYQDTNRVQFAITQLLVGSANNICVVGDVDQNIYSWRGANLANLLSFEEEFPGTTTVLLEENYRSTQTILTAANNVIEKNVKRQEKTLYTNNAAGDPLTHYTAASEEDEARFIVEEAAARIAAGVPARDIAVLYRANFQSRALEQAFMYAGIPYQVLGVRFFDRKEVKDVLAYIRAAMKLVSDPHAKLRDLGAGDVARIVAVPPRGIGKLTLAKVLDGREDELTSAARQKIDVFREVLKRIAHAAVRERPSETIRVAVHESGLEAKLKEGNDEDRERLENMKELATLATKYDDLAPEEGILALLEDAALATDQDSLERDHDAVKLMTVHAAKGLEFDYVFITGLEEGLFPYERLDDSGDDEEERRLFYVALTRARKHVYLTHAIVRTVFGTQALQAPSTFLDDIGDELIEAHDDGFASPHDRTVDLIEF